MFKTERLAPQGNDARLLFERRTTELNRINQRLQSRIADDKKDRLREMQANLARKICETRS
jgi:hypothetical protein